MGLLYLYYCNNNEHEPIVVSFTLTYNLIGFYFQFIFDRVTLFGCYVLFDLFLVEQKVMTS
jgi:hypothetical protein